MARKAKLGDQVSVHYKGKLKDGTEFDSSKEDDPIEFKIGEGQLIPGFEQAIVGMEPGETKTEEVPYEGAYGEKREDLVMELDKGKVPDHIDPQEGDRLEIKQDEGENIPVTVTKVTEEALTIDANHPLAGQDLVFDLELVEIKSGGQGEEKKQDSNQESNQQSNS